MSILIVGILIFLGIHFFATLRGPRAALISKYGLERYKIFYSVIAIVGLAVIIWGFGVYRSEGMIQIWDPPRWTRHLAMPLVWIAFIALASRRIPMPSRIRGLLRHPTLVAIKSWALAHLLVNGDLGGMLLFGSFLAFGVYDRIAVNKRGDGGAPLIENFASGDLVAIGAGTALFGILLFLHPLLFGVSVLGN